MNDIHANAITPRVIEIMVIGAALLHVIAVVAVPGVEAVDAAHRVGTVQIAVIAADVSQVEH